MNVILAGAERLTVTALAAVATHHVVFPGSDVGAAVQTGVELNGFEKACDPEAAPSIEILPARSPLASAWPKWLPGAAVLSDPSVNCFVLMDTGLKEPYPAGFHVPAMFPGLLAKSLPLATSLTR